MKKIVGKGGQRWYKNVGLGFRTPKEAIEGEGRPPAGNSGERCFPVLGRAWHQLGWGPQQVQLPAPVAAAAMQLQPCGDAWQSGAAQHVASQPGAAAMAMLAGQAASLSSSMMASSRQRVEPRNGTGANGLLVHHMAAGARC